MQRFPSNGCSLISGVSGIEPQIKRMMDASLIVEPSPQNPWAVLWKFPFCLQKPPHIKTSFLVILSCFSSYPSDPFRGQEPHYLFSQAHLRGTFVFAKLDAWTINSFENEGQIHNEVIDSFSLMIFLHQLIWSCGFHLSFCYCGTIYIFSFLLEDSCFTVLGWFLPYTSMNQPQVYIYPLPPNPRSHLPPRPAPLACHRALG